MKDEHLGSSFADFLREENLLDVAEATAKKRVNAFQTAKEMRRRRFTERLLDPTNPPVTLSTLERAASALGKKLKVELA